MKTDLSLTGIGLRSSHYAEFIHKKPSVAWVEVHSENYFAEGGKALQTLQQVRQDYPVSLHGVGLSLGSADELNWQHLKKLRDLCDRIDPCLVSDHLSWSSIEGRYFHDLIPFPYTEETLAYLISRVQQVQDYLNRQILIENITSYVTYPQATLSEPEFMNALAKQAGCGILLDVSNLYINQINLRQDPQTYITTLNKSLIQEIHLAGFSTAFQNEHEVLMDTHNRPIVPAVWDLYRTIMTTIGCKPTIIEWDSDLPTLETLYLEAYRAEKIMRETYAHTTRVVTEPTN